ncbi:MAG: penicillin-binding protein 2, partial [Acidobacteria bacterium]|nr:penicillin-binding protein 2 [Acidobacteriota bacterium]
MVQSDRSRRSDIGELSRHRVIRVGLLLAVWMVLIICRLAWIQIVHHDHYIRLSQEDQRRPRKTEPLRGSIVDRHNNLLAMSVVYQSVRLDQVRFNYVRLSSKEEKEGKRAEVMEKRRKAVRSLSGLLEMTESELDSKLVGTNKQLWFKRRLSPLVVEEVVKALEGIPGFTVVEEMERAYPNQELAAHLIGHLGANEKTTSRIGRAGIEQRLDDEMTGTKGEITLWVDARGRAFGRSDIKSRPGQDIQLTIDAALQRKVEYLLRQAVERHRAKGGAVVVMDPGNGEIHALANYPTFDPNRLDTGVASSAAYVNQAVMSPYEPGSIFKVVTYAAALEEGVIRPEEIIDCGNGQIAIGTRVIRDTHSYGRLTVEDSFAKSSNVGAIKIAQRLGKETFYDYITRFGFGAPTGIELPAESVGILHRTPKWRPDSIGSIAIGQEVSVTLIQAVRAVAAIANGGFLVTPHLVLKPEVGGGQAGASDERPARQARTRIIREETSRQMRQLMERVVTHGTGQQAVRIEGFTVAGKTGTPQKPGRSGYRDGRYMPSFLGFAPATEPRFAIVVMIDEPSDGSYYGGVVAAPVFSMVTEAALGDNDVVPDEAKFREQLDQLVRRHSVSGQP